MKRQVFEETDALENGTFNKWVTLYRQRQSEAAYELTMLWQTLAHRDVPNPFPRVSIVSYPNVGDCLIEHDNDRVLMYITDEKVRWYDTRGKKHIWSGWNRTDAWPWTSKEMPALPNVAWARVFQFLIARNAHDAIVMARSPILKGWFNVWNTLDHMWGALLNKRFPEWYLSVRTNPLIQLRKQISKYSHWFLSNAKGQCCSYILNRINRCTYPWNLLMDHVLNPNAIRPFKQVIEVVFEDHYVVLDVITYNYSFTIREPSGKLLCTVDFSNPKYLLNPEKKIKIK